MRIIYIDIDTLRADHLGCYGYHRNTTPNIDQIAEEGSIFTNCYASDAPCLPSRASMFMGRFGIHTGIVGHGGTAADLRLKGKDRGFEDQRYENFWVNLIRSAGYHTVSISPYAERHSAYWFYAPFKEIYNPGKKGMEIADTVYPYAKKWLKENGKKDNWFLHINTWDPHTPYRVPKKYGNPFEADPPPSWMTQEIIDQHRNSYGPRSARDLLGFGDEEKFFVRAFPRIHKGEIENLEDYKNWIDGYDTGIRYADDLVEKLVNLLNDLGIYEDTLIMISADHGESQGELNVYGDHATADHIVNRIPMVIKWPGKNWEKKYDNLVYQTDIAATIARGIGKKIPDIWDGKSFFEEIENDEDFGRPYLVISQNAWSSQRAVIFDRWTMIKTYHTGMKDYPELMLFDRKNDFHMLNNLAEKRTEIVAQGSSLLEKWQTEMMSISESQIDPLWTVWNEGGPSHCRGMLDKYIERLKKTNREHLIPKLLDRDESYS
jgi:arylsulfatase A-like enzyme